MNPIQVKFETTASSHGRQRIATTRSRRPTAPRVPHITKLMALAIRLEHLLANGEVKDQAEIARTAGITRARVTQILNLTNLAPNIQEASLNLEPAAERVWKIREPELRQIATIPKWEKQHLMWKRLVRLHQNNHPPK